MKGMASILQKRVRSLSVGVSYNRKGRVGKEGKFKRRNEKTFMICARGLVNNERKRRGLSRNRKG